MRERQLACVAMKRFTCWALAGLSIVACKDEEARKSIDGLRQDLQALETKVGTVETSTGEAAAELKKMTAELEKALDAQWIGIPVDATGNEACASKGMSCLAVSPGKTFDGEDRFCGYTLFDCNARVYKIPGCATGKDYAVRPSRFVQQPKAPGACEHTGQLCVDVQEYQAALCAQRTGPEMKGVQGQGGAAGAPSEVPAAE
jgi:hypothetical protein